LCHRLPGPGIIQEQIKVSRAQFIAHISQPHRLLLKLTDGVDLEDVLRLRGMYQIVLLLLIKQLSFGQQGLRCRSKLARSQHAIQLMLNGMNGNSQNTE